MSDEKTYSEAEVREREARAARAAFAAGVHWWHFGPPTRDDETPGCAAHAEARRRYPLTRRVPRVVTVVRDGVEWEVKRCNDGFYARSHPSADWTLQFASCTPDNVRALVDLLDNPFDEVTE
jgi:hypothetical protein